MLGVGGWLRRHLLGIDPTSGHRERTQLESAKLADDAAIMVLDSVSLGLISCFLELFWDMSGITSVNWTACDTTLRPKQRLTLLIPWLQLPAGSIGRRLYFFATISRSPFQL